MRSYHKTSVSVSLSLYRFASENKIALSTLLNAALELLRDANVVPPGRNVTEYKEAIIEAVLKLRPCSC